MHLSGVPAIHTCSKRQTLLHEYTYNKKDVNCMHVNPVSYQGMYNARLKMLARMRVPFLKILMHYMTVETNTYPVELYRASLRKKSKHVVWFVRNTRQYVYTHSTNLCLLHRLTNYTFYRNVLTRLRYALLFA